MARDQTFKVLLLAVLLVPTGALAAGEQFIDLVDVPSAHTLPRGAYSLGLRVVPDGGIIAGLRVGVTPYLQVGVSYGAGNVVGTGEPDWNDRVEFDIKLRLAEEQTVIPALAAGYDSRGYGSQLEDGGYEKASVGFHLTASKTLPFSEYWQAHFGVSRTMEEERVKPDLYAGATARFSQEFSVAVEYQLGDDRKDRSPGSKNGYLNAGLRWVFAGELELSIHFRNLTGRSGTPELASRSLAFVFYDSF
ncbi:MAG: hypothetical protein GF400_01235 [Candidatus Eisenbacteria bacterium]|nr:hypothetical protein [Candidatus Eisenbacteria bacterium]